MFKRLALERQFDLGDDQSVVFAMKDVDLPHLVSDSLLIPRLLDERALTQAVVQTFATDAAKRSGTLCGLCGENCIPNSWRGFAINAKLSEFELTFPDPMHDFNAGYGDRDAPKALQSKHWTQTKFDRSMVLLYQIIIWHV